MRFLVIILISFFTVAECQSQCESKECANVKNPFLALSWPSLVDINFQIDLCFKNSYIITPKASIMYSKCATYFMLPFQLQRGLEIKRFTFYLGGGITNRIDFSPYPKTKTGREQWYPDGGSWISPPYSVLPSASTQIRYKLGKFTINGEYLLICRKYKSYYIPSSNSSTKEIWVYAHIFNIGFGKIF